MPWQWQIKFRYEMAHRSLRFCNSPYLSCSEHDGLQMVMFIDFIVSLGIYMTFFVLIYYLFSAKTSLFSPPFSPFVWKPQNQSFFYFWIRAKNQIIMTYNYIRQLNLSCMKYFGWTQKQTDSGKQYTPLFFITKTRTNLSHHQ